MSALIAFRFGFDYFVARGAFDCFFEDVVRAAAGDAATSGDLKTHVGVQALILELVPEDAASRILRAMQRTAEATLEGKLPGWSRDQPDDADGQRSYRHMVAELLYYTKIDLGLVPALPPRRGKRDLVQSIVGTCPYWVHDSFLDDVIEQCRGDEEAVRRLQWALTEGQPVLAGLPYHWEELANLACDCRILRAIKAVVEAARRGQTPGWLRNRPGDEDGRRLYLQYLADGFHDIDDSIGMTDAFYAEYYRDAAKDGWDVSGLPLPTSEPLT